MFDPEEPASNYAMWRDDEQARPFFRDGEDGVRLLEVLPGPSVERIGLLPSRAPHMSALWDEVVTMASAAVAAGVPLVLDPIVVLGPPGVGKTWAVNQITSCLALEGGTLSMAGTSLNEGIQGSHPSWRNAGPGFVARTFASSRSANPLIFVDEFDKAGSHSNRSDPYGPYLALLEPEGGGTTFVDEFLGIHFMTSMVSWIFTANDLRCLPDPIVDRLKVVEVGRPDRDQARAMLGAMLAAEHGRYPGSLSEAVPDEVLDALSGLTPRRARLCYSTGMARAVSAGRRGVRRSDLPVERKSFSAGFLR